MASIQRLPLWVISCILTCIAAWLHRTQSASRILAWPPGAGGPLTGGPWHWPPRSSSSHWPSSASSPSSPWSGTPSPLAVVACFMVILPLVQIKPWNTFYLALMMLSLLSLFQWVRDPEAPPTDLCRLRTPLSSESLTQSPETVRARSCQRWHSVHSGQNSCNLGDA